VKKLIRLFVLLVLLAAGGLAWFQQSVHYAILELARAGREGDVATMEKHLDVEAFVDVAGDFAKALAAEEAKRVTGDGLIGELAGALAGAVAGAVTEAAKPEAAAEIRRRLAQGEAFDAFGPFVPYDNFTAIGDVTTEGDKARVMIAGTCHGEPGHVMVLFERVPGIAGIKLIGTWKAVGVDTGSLLILAETCKEARAKLERGTPP
jgi:hypothetical protein